MKKVLSLLTGRNSIIILVAILSILDTLLVASFFLEPILKFLIEKHLFEIIVLTTLLEILLLLSHNLWRSSPWVFGSEGEVQEKVRFLLKEDTSIKFVKILSAGLSSRAAFLRVLLEVQKRLNVEIIACFGHQSPNPDQLDREKLGPANFDVITNRLKPDEMERLKIRGSLNAPSVRLILLSDSRGPRYAFLGWYTYHKKNTHIVGRQNVQIFADRTTELGVDLLHFAEKMFQRYSSDEESVTLFPPS